MNFFKNILQLIISPDEGWNSIKKFNVPRAIFSSKVFFPLLGILSISVFVQYFYSFSGTLTDYLQISIIECSSYYFGYIISAFILGYYVLNGESDETLENKVHIFTLYLYSILMMLSIINNLLPTNFAFLDLFQFYLVYIVYKGSKFLNMESENLKFVVIASLTLLLSLYSIQTILKYLLL